MNLIRIPAREDALAALGYAVPHWVSDGDPQEFGRVYADGAARRTVVGLWEARAGTLEIDDYPFDEFCVVLDGGCELTPVGGATERFRPGEAFLIRKGFRGTWRMPHGLRKWYVELHG